MELISQMDFENNATAEGVSVELRRDEETGAIVAYETGHQYPENMIEGEVVGLDAAIDEVKEMMAEAGYSPKGFRQF